jgi:hypothetical protein
VGKYEYLRIVEDVKLANGEWTTKIIKTYGQFTDKKLKQAEQLLGELTGSEAGAPRLKVNPTPRERFRSIGEGPLGLISPENTPFLTRALLNAAEIGVTALINRYGLKKAIKLLQPHLKSEEVERFYTWVEKKPFEEQVKILVKDWYYPQGE